MFCLLCSCIYQRPTFLSSTLACTTSTTSTNIRSESRSLSRTMKASTFIITLTGFVAIVIAVPALQGPICTFDSTKGGYICPTATATAPPICKFDPVKGEYICPPTAAATDLETTLTDTTAAKCGQEGLQKCTRERQGSVCKIDEWEVIYRCATGQQCDIKDGNFCCRTRGPGFNC